jgi:GNAT superfamily N-acetyltransferase
MTEQQQQKPALAATRLRRAAAEDLPAVLELFVASGLDAREDVPLAGAQQSWQAMQALGAEVWLAECQLQGGSIELLGCLTLYVLPLLAHRQAPEALVEDVAVHPKAQGLGLGRLLMEQAMAVAQARGCYKLALSSNAKRVDAHAFYEHIGFTRHGLSFHVPLKGDSRS